MSVTAAGAARKAAEWAQHAENSRDYEAEERLKGDAFTAERDNGRAAMRYLFADKWERERTTAVEMANMWAHVAGVLHLAEGGEPS